jgi:hypothetical protein
MVQENKRGMEDCLRPYIVKEHKVKYLITRSMNFLLKLKTWMLFMLTFVLPVLFSFIPVFGNSINTAWLSIYIGWIFSIGTSMHALIPDKNKPSVNYFKLNFFLVVLAYILITITGWYKVSLGESFQWVFIPIMIYLAWGLLYASAFAARMLESMIEGKIVSFSDSVKGLFCFWFFPFGLWYIQPAVQRVLNKYK